MELETGILFGTILPPHVGDYPTILFPVDELEEEFEMAMDNFHERYPHIQHPENRFMPSIVYPMKMDDPRMIGFWVGTTAENVDLPLLKSPIFPNKLGKNLRRAMRRWRRFDLAIAKIDSCIKLPPAEIIVVQVSYRNLHAVHGNRTIPPTKKISA